jgi:putative Mn2+ efflux pump MntP
MPWAGRGDAVADAVQASVANFCGALLPPGFSVAFPAFPWLPLLLAIGILTFLGLVIGRRLGGNPGLWAVALAAAGIILIVIGAALNIA